MDRRELVDAVRKSIDDAAKALGAYLVDNFDSVSERASTWDLSELLKYVRRDLTAFTPHISNIISLDEAKASATARNLIGAALQVRHAAAHYSEGKPDPLQIDTTAGAISAMQTLLSLLRTFGVERGNSGVMCIEERTRRLMEQSASLPDHAAQLDVSAREGHSADSMVTNTAPKTPWRFRILSGPHQGIMISVAPHEFPVVFGRGASQSQGKFVDVSIYAQDPKNISRRHCEFQVSAGGLLVRDLGSTNGTQLNGVEIGLGSGKLGDVRAVGNSAVVSLANELELALL